MIIGHTVVGSGPSKVVVLHGWLSDASVFAPSVPYLNVGRFSYAFVDYRGYGLSRSMSGAYTIAEIASDVRALVDHLGWESFNLLGHSMGGLAAQQVLIDLEPRVRRWVGLTPVPPMGGPTDSQSDALFSGAAGNDAMRRGIIDYSTGARFSSAALDWMVRRSRETCTVEAFDAYQRAFRLTDLSSRAKGIKTAMLVAVGQHDQALTAAIMQATYQQVYPQARVTTIEGAGHYPMLEATPATVRLWEDFLAPAV